MYQSFSSFINFRNSFSSSVMSFIFRLCRLCKFVMGSFCTARSSCYAFRTWNCSITCRLSSDRRASRLLRPVCLSILCSLSFLCFKIRIVSICWVMGFRLEIQSPFMDLWSASFMKSGKGTWFSTLLACSCSWTLALCSWRFQWAGMRWFDWMT